MKIRERLAELLEQKRWNQSDLARELGEHRNWVNYRLTGRVDIKAEDLPRIAAALGISPCDFFEERVSPVPQQLYRAVKHVLVEAGEMEEVRPMAEETESRPAATKPEEGELGTFRLSTADELMAEWRRDIRRLDPSSRKSLQLTAELIQAALRLAEGGTEDEAAS